MSIEELKLILETVNGVSSSAVWVVCLYFGMGILHHVIAGAIGLLIAWWIRGLIFWVIKSFTFVGNVLYELGVQEFPQYESNQKAALNKLRKAIAEKADV